MKLELVVLLSLTGVGSGTGMVGGVWLFMVVDVVGIVIELMESNLQVELFMRKL
jgi:hypothetical protein